MSTLPSVILQGIYQEVALEQCIKSALSIKQKVKSQGSSDVQVESIFLESSNAQLSHVFSNPEIGRPSLKATAITIEEEDSTEGVNSEAQIKDEAINTNNQVTNDNKERGRTMTTNFKHQNSLSSIHSKNLSDKQKNISPVGRSNLKTKMSHASKMFERSMSLPMNKVTFIFENEDNIQDVADKNVPSFPVSSNDLQSQEQTDKILRIDNKINESGAPSAKPSGEVNQSIPIRKASSLKTSKPKVSHSGGESPIGHNNKKVEFFQNASPKNNKNNFQNADKKLCLTQASESYKKRGYFSNLAAVSDKEEFFGDQLVSGSQNNIQNGNKKTTIQIEKDGTQLGEDDNQEFLSNEMQASLVIKKVEKGSKKSNTPNGTKKVDIAPVSISSVWKYQSEIKSSRESSTTHSKRNDNKKSNLKILNHRGIALADQALDMSPLTWDQKSKSSVSSPMSNRLTPRGSPPNQKTFVNPNGINGPKLPQTKFMENKRQLSTNVKNRSSNRVSVDKKEQQNAQKKQTSPMKTKQYAAIHAQRNARINTANLSNYNSPKKTETTNFTKSTYSINEQTSYRVSPEKSIKSFLEDTKQQDGMSRASFEQVEKGQNYVEIDPEYLEPFLTKTDSIERIGTPQKVYMKIIDHILQTPESPQASNASPARSRNSVNASPKPYKGGNQTPKLDKLNLDSPSNLAYGSRKTSTAPNEKKSSVPNLFSESSNQNNQNLVNSRSNTYNIYVPRSPVLKSSTDLNNSKGRKQDQKTNDVKKKMASTQPLTISIPGENGPLLNIQISESMKDSLKSTSSQTPSEQKANTVDSKSPTSDNNAKQNNRTNWELNNASSLYKKLGNLTLESSSTIYNQQSPLNINLNPRNLSNSAVLNGFISKTPNSLQDFAKNNALKSPKPSRNLTPKSTKAETTGYSNKGVVASYSNKLTPKNGDKSKDNIQINNSKTLDEPSQHSRTIYQSGNLKSSKVI